MEAGPKFQGREDHGLDQGSGSGFVRTGQVLCAF